MKEAVEGRAIDYVWHFTRLENLEGILTHGLLGRPRIAALGIPSSFNDEYRFDGHDDAICCSLGDPNYKMFYSLRQTNPGTEWVVLVLHASVLWEKECAFCASNAASNPVTCIPLVQRKGVAAFNLMFQEIPGKPPRNELGISDSCPTDPQAEVLVFGNIETKYIAGVITQSKQTEAALKERYPGFEFLYHRALFSARKDYEHWK
ncbi:MAG: DarT ssDNA thymidine ADP-ribosyltransferase family protein [Acidithiobacillus sp.]